MGPAGEGVGSQGCRQLAAQGISSGLEEEPRGLCLVTAAEDMGHAGDKRDAGSSLDWDAPTFAFHQHCELC